MVATRLLPRGTITWVRDPLNRLVSREEIAGFPPLLRSMAETYTFLDAGGAAVLCWDRRRSVLDPLLAPS